MIFIEGEMLYNQKGEVPDGEHLVPLGVADVKREGKDVTLVAHAKMVAVALKAAEELAKEGIDAEVIDPRTLRPLDLPTIIASVRKTNRCVVVEEGWPFASIGAAVVDGIQREAFDDLDAPVLRVIRRRRADAVQPPAREARQAGRRESRGGRQESPLPGLTTWPPRSSWRRCRPRWKRGASSRGRSAKATP